MRMERRVLTPMRSVDDSVYVLNVYTLAGEWGTGSYFLVVPSIDVSRHCIRLGKTKRSKVFKSDERQRFHLGVESM